MIWLTGSSGFIGKNFFNICKSDYDILRLSYSDQITDNVYDKNKVINIDYSRHENITKLIEKYSIPETVIHFGWGKMEEPMSIYHLEQNIVNSNNFINHLYENGIRRIIFIGSMNEYGSRKGKLSENQKPIGRLTNYAKGKIEVSNHGFKIASKYESIFIHVRPFYVYGYGQRKSSLINELINAKLDQRTTVLGPCEHYRDYVFVDDVVSGIEKLIYFKKSFIFNIGSGGCVKVKDFVKLFWNELNGADDKLIFGEKAQNINEPDQLESYADTKLLTKYTNWYQNYSLVEGIKSTIEKFYINYNQISQ